MKTTIIIPCSRPDFLQRIFAQLEMMDCDRENTNLFVYVDGPIQLYELPRNYTSNSKFADKLCQFRGKGMPNVGSVKSRRKRIADIHNEIKEYIKPCDYVFILEDDTLPPLDTLTKLHHTFALNPYAGFVSGIEIGRWGYDMIGAWKANDVYDATSLTTLPLLTGIHEADAAGLYCCMIRYDVYKKHTFEPFGEMLGPDVDFGIKLRQQGYKNFVDFSIKCKHLTKRGEIFFDKTNIVQVEIAKTATGWSQRAL